MARRLKDGGFRTQSRSSLAHHNWLMSGLMLSVAQAWLRAVAGGPSKGLTTTMQQIAIRLPKPMPAMIDEIVSGRLDQPERSAIIRELVAEPLAGREGRKK